MAPNIWSEINTVKQIGYFNSTRGGARILKTTSTGGYFTPPWTLRNSGFRKFFDLFYQHGWPSQFFAVQMGQSRRVRTISPKVRATLLHIHPLNLTSHSASGCIHLDSPISISDEKTFSNVAVEQLTKLGAFWRCRQTASRLLQL